MGRKILVLLISIVAIGSLISGFIYQRYYKTSSKPPVSINSQGSPTIGNPQAKVHIVAFEDFRCPHCAEFAETVFPKIRDAYIKTGKVRYTLIPVAFLPGSKPLANAALEVYKTTPDLFFDYADAIFSNSPTTNRDLLHLGVEIKGIDVESLKSCLQTDCNYPKLDQNLQEIKKAMGPNFATPAIYINGVYTPWNYGSIEERINELLKRRL